MKRKIVLRNSSALLGLCLLFFIGGATSTKLIAEPVASQPCFRLETTELECFPSERQCSDCLMHNYVNIMNEHKYCSIIPPPIG
jgi:hypothetical protein